MTYACLPNAALLIGSLAIGQVLPPHGTAPAAELGPAPAPLTALPADTRFLVRLHDHARASNRWADGPYGMLLATAWGRRLEDRQTQTPGPFQLLHQISVTQTALFGITVVDHEPLGHLIGTLPAGAHFQAPGSTVAGVAPAVTATIPLRTYQLDQPLRQGGLGITDWIRFRWEALQPLPLASLTTSAAPDADAEATWLAALQAQQPPLRIAGAWTFTPYGLRERIQVHDLPPVAAAAQAPTLDRAALAGLPPTTLWAVATAALPTLAERLPGFTAEAFDGWAEDSGVPTWSVMRGALGSALLWSEESSPFPGLSLAVQMPEDLGKTVLRLLDAKVRFVPGDNGVHLGAMGFIPAQAAWRDGWLYLTTANGGITAASTRQGGFLGVPEIADAERELQHGPKPVGDLLALGFSRSATSWNAVASLAGWFTRRNPSLGTLAADLRAAGKFGFLAVRRSPEAATVDAGGLLGGPISGSQILGGFLGTFLSGGRPPGEPQGQGGPRPDDPAPVTPPALVEF